MNVKAGTLALVSVAAALLAASAMAGENNVGEHALRLVARHRGVFTAPPRRVPTNKVVDGPVLGNGDVGVAMAGPPESQLWCISKNDFWSTSRRCVITVGGLRIAVPALGGASYRQEQDILKAEVRGTFAKDGLSVETSSWVAATEGLLVTELSCTGKPVEVTLTQSLGPGRSASTARIRETGRHVNIGREQHGSGRWYFHGLLDDVRIYGRALSADEVKALAEGKDVPGGLAKRWSFDDGDADGKLGKAKSFDGKTTWVDGGPLRLKSAVTIAAWVRPASFQPSGSASYIVSKGEWSQAYSLGLSADKLRVAVGNTFAQTPKPLAVGKWQHVAGTFDGSGIKIYVGGKQVQGGGSDAAGDTAAKVEGGVAWFTRRADPATVKEARTAAVATRVLGAEAKGEDGLHVALEPGQKAIVVTAILSDLDAKEPLGAARKRVTGLTVADVARLGEQHRAWWRGFWSRSFVEIGDPLLERFWYGSHYLMASCSRAGKVPPGLFGNWITTDKPAWAGDFHLNYNHQAPFWGLYSSNHVDTAASYETPILEYLPQAKANAQKLLKCRGVYYPVGIGPWGITSGSGASFWGQKSNASYAATNFVMRFYSTHDLDYAKTIAYPFLREVGDFWEDYLKLEDGRYVDYNDAIHEGHTPKDVNPILSLGLIPMVFRALLDMSKELGVDEKRRAKWQHILDHMPDYPVQEMKGKTVFRYSERGQAWFRSNTLGIQHIWPAGAIGLDSDPKLLEVARNTHAALSRWRDHNGFPTFFTAAARIGIDPKLILDNLRHQLEHHSYPNLFVFYGGGGIECCSAVPTCINEMLLQSHEGVLRLFPCWPKERHARFGTLRAYGAFLVSAELKGGQVQPVRITSERGRACTVLNPWPGRSIRLSRAGKAAQTLRGTRVTFKTRAGQSVTLAPAD